MVLTPAPRPRSWKWQEATYSQETSTEQQPPTAPPTCSEKSTTHWDSSGKLDPPGDSTVSLGYAVPPGSVTRALGCWTRPDGRTGFGGRPCPKLRAGRAADQSSQGEVELNCLEKPHGFRAGDGDGSSPSGVTTRSPHPIPSPCSKPRKMTLYHFLWIQEMLDLGEKKESTLEVRFLTT